MKLKYKDKLNIINDIENGNSLNKVAIKYRVNTSTAKYLYRLYKRHGKKILKHTFTKHSIEFKEKAVKRITQQKESIHSVSIDLGLKNPGTLSRWVKEYQVNCNSFPIIKRGRPKKAD